MPQCYCSTSSVHTYIPSVLLASSFYVCRVAVTVPRTMHRLKKRFPPRPRAAKRNQEVEIVKLPPIDTKHKNFERRKSRPFGGRKNKEGREKGIEDHRAVSSFHAYNSMDYSHILHYSIVVCK